MSRCLRHEAEYITEDGWVELPDLLEYRLNWQEKYFTDQVIRDAVEENFKPRIVVRDNDSRPYVAAWSGYTIDGVYGPGARVALEDVPRYWCMKGTVAM